jgi:hypothetical protein
LLPKRWLAFLILLGLAGCGYRPLGTEPRFTAVRPSLAIPLFTNNSTEVGLEAIMANALVQTFGENKLVRLAPRPEEADLVLEGKVQSVENSSVAYVDVNRSVVRRVRILVELNLRRRDNGKTIWKESTILQEDYVVFPNYHMGEVTKAEGLRRAAVTLARRVLDKILLVI